MEKAVQTLRKEFDTMIGRFLSSSVHANNSSPELEIRFGTNPQSRLTKMDYDNVVQQLYQAGYECPDKQGTHLLRVSPEYDILNKQEQLTKSKLRLEIIGTETIEEYCRANDDLPSMYKVHKPIRFTIKSRVQPDVAFPDFGFRVSSQMSFILRQKIQETRTYFNNGINIKKRIDTSIVFVFIMVPFLSFLIFPLSVGPERSTAVRYLKIPYVMQVYFVTKKRMRLN